MALTGKFKSKLQRVTSLLTEQNPGLTSQDGFVAAVAAWRILSGAALPAHDAVVLGAERLLGQRLVTLCTTETLLMPVPALMAELLMDERI